MQDARDGQSSDDRTHFAPAFARSASSGVPRGTRLNGVYEIESLIANGGMGEVYKGHNIQTQDPVAIKMILPELSSNPDAFALFKREASTLHNLHHEAIVRYFVFSVDPALQRAYLAMEYVEGPSLTTLLSRGPLDLASVRLLQRRLADALAAAHRFGVIHRDISPDNIILPGADVRRATIIDFGIARSQRPGEGTIIGGGFAGKYNYVSPEQLGLAGGEVTPKSDIYSLGLVLAEALRGRPIEMNGTQFEVIEKRRVVPDLTGIDASMRPLLQAMLQPLPADRPDDMAAVAAWGQPTTLMPAPDYGAAPLLSGAGATHLNGSVTALPRKASAKWPALAAAAVVIIAAAGTVYEVPDLQTGSLQVGGSPLRNWLPWLPWIKAQHAVIVADKNGGDKTKPSSPDGTSSEQPLHHPPPLPNLGVPDKQTAQQNSTDVFKTPSTTPQGLGGQQPSGLPTQQEASNGGGASTGDQVPGETPHPTTGTDTIKPDDGLSHSEPANQSSGLPADGQSGATPQKHVPSADEILASLAEMKRKEEEAQAAAISKLPQMPSTDTQPFDAGKPSDTTKPVDATKPLDTSKPSDTSKPLDVSKPADTMQQADNADPFVKSLPVDPFKHPKTGMEVASLEPPRAPQRVLSVEDAVVGQDYLAALPPFDNANPASLKLRPDKKLPDGLVFTDHGSGFGVISGRPKHPGQFAFDVVATNATGATAKMTTRITVAALPSQSQVSTDQSSGDTPVQGPLKADDSSGATGGTQMASLTPVERVTNFVHDFDGGPCFFVRSIAATNASVAIEGFGSDAAPFQKLESAVVRDNGFDPAINLRQVTAAQCGAVNLAATVGNGSGDAPSIDLVSFKVGRNQPLVGNVGNVAGRHLDLLLVTNDGQVLNLDGALRPGTEGTASFSVPMTPEASSVGAPQLLIALAADKPLDSLSGFRAADASDILPRIRKELQEAGGTSLDLKLFELVD